MIQYASEKHHKERLYSKSIAIRAVLLAQKEAKELGMTYEEMSAYLRGVSIRRSSTACMFARRLGIACIPSTEKGTKSAVTPVVVSAFSTKELGNRFTCYIRNVAELTAPRA